MCEAVLLCVRVLEQIAEVVGCAVSPDSSTFTGQGLITRGCLDSLAALLAASGSVFVIGVINGVLYSQPLGLLHVGPFLSEGHGLPGLTYEKTTAEF